TLASGDPNRQRGGRRGGGLGLARNRGGEQETAAGGEESFSADRATKEEGLKRRPMVQRSLEEDWGMTVGNCWNQQGGQNDASQDRAEGQNRNFSQTGPAAGGLSRSTARASLLYFRGERGSHGRPVARRG